MKKKKKVRKKKRSKASRPSKRRRVRFRSLKKKIKKSRKKLKKKLRKKLRKKIRKKSRKRIRRKALPKKKRLSKAEKRAHPKPHKELKKPSKAEKTKEKEEDVEATADRSSMQIYLKQIEKIPLLTPGEEISLAKLIATKGKKAFHAREKMIRSNLRLVISIAKRYTNLGLLFSDIVEEGNIGLMRAVEKFNWRKGYRFSTYASWWIKQAIMRAISNFGKTIRIPVYMFDTISRFRKVRDALTQKVGRAPTTKELAKALKCNEEKIQELETTLSVPSSLNAPISLEGTAELMDLIEDDRSQSPHQAVESTLRNDRIEQLLSCVDKREKEILTRRFGLNSRENETLEQVAKEFKITRERVRQIECKALEKIRAKLKEQSDRLSNYVE